MTFHSNEINRKANYIDLFIYIKNSITFYELIYLQ